MHINEITRELFYEKTRITLTILAIAWGTFAIASMLAIGEGLRLTFAKAVASAGSNLLTIASGRTSKKFHGIHSNLKIKLTNKDYQSVTSLPNVATASSQYDFGAKLTYSNKNLGFGRRTFTKIQAVSPQYAAIHLIKIEAGGRFINAQDLKQRSNVIVLGTRTRKELFPNNGQSIGKYVLIDTQPFLVIGVMQAKPQFMAKEEPDAYLNWIPVTTYELLVNPTSIDQISVTYKDPKLLEQTKTAIQKVIAINHSVDPTDTNIVNIDDIAKIQNTINTFFVGMQIFLGVVGCLTLIIAAIGIANVMYASVRRATSEIGVRMALGAKTHHILLHYIAESLAATIIGGIIGLIITAALVYGMQHIPMHGKLIDAIGKPQPVLSILVISIVVLTLGLMGFLAGLFPALKASKIDPATALIYE